MDQECTIQPTSVGHPTLGCEARIVDENMNEVPGGAVGEIAVKGPHVADGYYEDTEETRKAFRDGWFLTGDLGRVDEEGFFYVVSRKKGYDQSRRRECLSGPRSKTSSTFTRKCLKWPCTEYRIRLWGEKVAAALVAVPGTTPTIEEIKEFCSDKLAKYRFLRANQLCRLPAQESRRESDKGATIEGCVLTVAGKVPISVFLS